MVKINFVRVLAALGLAAAVVAIFAAFLFRATAVRSGKIAAPICINVEADAEIYASEICKSNAY